MTCLRKAHGMSRCVSTPRQHHRQEERMNETLSKHDLHDYDQRQEKTETIVIVIVNAVGKLFPARSACGQRPKRRMAFESGTKLFPCMQCGTELPYFKMLQNDRKRAKEPQTYAESIGETAATGSKAMGRVCVECEARLRGEDWERMTDKQKEAAGTDYMTPERVRKDMKAVNKGKAWADTAKSLVQARDEVKGEEKETGVRVPKRQRNKMILARAQELAEALVGLLNQSIPVWEAFTAAGDRMFKGSKLWDQLQQEYDKFTEDPSDKNLESLEELEELWEKSQEYTALKEKGDQQADYLKALDFLDHVTENMRMYNVCRAQVGQSGTCGLAYPSKLWTQTPGKWKFYCRVDWNNLVSAAVSLDDESPLKKWTQRMIMRYGDNVGGWPHIGCGAKFVPWARGESMVAEIRLGSGKWEAFCADRMPRELDDEIKKVHADFFEASKFLDPAELKDVLPVSLPMTHVLEDDLVGIAKYPIDMWELQGQPRITAKGWVKLAMMIASKRMDKLASVFQCGEKLEARL